MTRTSTTLLTALAPAIWGTSYLVTTEALPNLDAMVVSLSRALPAGVLLLLIVRVVPRGIWIPRMLVLGALNFSIFWTALFFAAYRLPGGVAAVIGALQPFMVLFLARAILGAPFRALAVAATLAGLVGVALLLLTPEARLDGLGIAAGLVASLSMALGTVLSRKWQPPVDALTFTAWQLTAGGLLLLPVIFVTPVRLADLTTGNLLGLAYLGLIGAALTYVIWLNGIAKLQPVAVSILGFFSPVTATILGWYFLNETLNGLQLAGIGIVLGSVFAGQAALRRGSEVS